MTAPERIWAFSADDIAENEGGATIVAHESYQPYATEYVRADLAAVQPDPNAGAVKVKPLVWDDDGYGNFRAQSIRGGEGVDRLTEPQVIGDDLVNYDAWGIRDAFDSPEAAQAAVEVEIASEIMAALEPQPDPRVAGYDQAYQYALTLADVLMAKHYPDNKDWQPLGDLTGLLTQIDNMVAGKMPDPRDEVIARLVEAASLVSDWDEWAFQVGGVCPDRLVNCMGRLRAALAAAKTLTKETKE